MRRLPAGAEAVIVVAIGLGYFVVLGVWMGLSPESIAGPISGEALWGLVQMELVLGLLLGAFLWGRGWRLAPAGPPAARPSSRHGAPAGLRTQPARSLGLAPSLRDTWIGLALTLAAWLLVAAGWAAVAGALPEVARQTAADFAGHAFGDVSLPMIVAVSLVNPLYEEALVCGYVVSFAAPRWGAAAAVVSSTVLRVLYHLYQGPIGILAMAPVGVLFAGWYARTGRLWPVVVAHAILDFNGLTGTVGS